MKEMIINMMSVMAIFTQNRVLSWIGTIILVWFIVNFLIRITEPKKTTTYEDEESKEAEEE